MAKQHHILANVREYSAEEIAIAVSNGEITIYELKKTAQFTPRLEAKVKQYLDGTLQLPDPEAEAKAPETEPQPQPSPAPAQPTAVPPTPRKRPAAPRRHQSEPAATTLPPTPSTTDGYIATQPPYIPAQPQYPLPNTQPAYPRRPGMFAAPFSFKGRIRRLEFNLSLVLFWLVYVLSLSFSILGFVDDSVNPAIGLMSEIILFLSVWFIFAQGCKRCHDLGHSGAWQLIPFYGLWMIFEGSEYGDNLYGPSPK